MIGAESAARTLVTLGHGYCARALAARLGPGWRAIGSTRREDRLARLRAERVAPVLWDDRAAVEEAIGVASHLLVSAPPDVAGDPLLARHRGALGAAERLRWIGYLSTTGVYGDRGGAWVDEAADLAPVNQRSQWRAEAEMAWLRFGVETGLPVMVFRLAGIYGPGRSAFERLRAGRAQRVIKEGQVFSRIHVEDIAAVLEASIARPRAGRIYNVADDEPAPPEDVIEHAARLIGMAVPPGIPYRQAELSPMARSFYAESKRVANRRITQELGVRLRHPDYRAGLAAILAAEGAAGPPRRTE
ncbi:SDR family oxidoreductase [soil metagenome]